MVFSGQKCVSALRSGCSRSRESTLVPFDGRWMDPIVGVNFVVKKEIRVLAGNGFQVVQS